MKKSFDTHRQLEIHIFFLDRNLGREKLPKLLREAGFVIQVHDEHFARDENDDIWLEQCGRRHWIAITPDTCILKEPVNMRAIGRSKGRVFFLSSNNVRSEVWAQTIISAWREINAVLERHNGPFVARVSLSGLVWGVAVWIGLGNKGANTTWERKKEAEDQVTAFQLTKY